VLEFLEAQQQYDIDGKIAAIRQASDLAPGSVWTYWLATSLIAAGRFDEGLATFEQIDRSYGWTHKWPQFWQVFVEALSRVDHDRELEIAREARLALPTLLNPLWLEARALGAMRRWPEFRRVVNEMRTFPDPDHQLGQQLHILGMAIWTGAMLGENPKSDTLLANELVAEAIDWFAALPANVSQGFRIRLSRATALMNANRCDEARPILEQLVEEQPREYRAQHALGVCLAQLGEPARAEAVIDFLVANADSADWNYMWVAGIAAELGDHARAVRYLREVRSRGHQVIFRRFIFKYFDGMKDYAPFLAITEPPG
jgi:predicted Zn-dependent protease